MQTTTNDLDTFLNIVETKRAAGVKMVSNKVVGTGDIELVWADGEKTVFTKTL